MRQARILTAVTVGLAAFTIVAGAGVASARSTSPMHNSPLTVTRGSGHVAHIMPTVQARKALCPSTCADPGPLVYHAGGAVMQTTTAYLILWAPPTRQSGNPTSMSTPYRNWAQNLLNDMGGHGIYNIATQYYQSIGTQPKAWIKNVSQFGGVYTDTHAYPASGCVDAGVPVVTDCITDAQIQAEINRVRGIKGWTGGLNHLFFVFTSSNEGSCFTAASTSCAYTHYCAYHSFINAATPVIYANEPYGNPTNCLGDGTTPTHQGQDATIVAALTAASHEHQEAVTDPMLNAWYTSQGNENGDLCAYSYGTNTWDGATANQAWNGHFYELQQEYSNHSLSCLLVGP